MSNNSSREEVLFEEAVKRASEVERAAYLDEACRGHPETRARLELLLEGYFKAGGFLPEQAEPRPAAADEAIGSIIGRYKLLEKIGEGGFGAVYLAEQKEPLKRRVALKIIKLGMDTKQVVARFEAERQALALMDHPNIAKVHDGGATDMGRPYFVMELVRGVSITKYCDENELPPRERLELFVRVCQAVQHAHQKGIIHRDLKPSNILVTVNDGVAVPKVIDFGVAKATQQELTEKTILTQFHHFIGTPAYMSPEQAEMTSVDIDTRSDIYSLGVLLYELLTGQPPFDGKELLASGLDEMRRIIREKEPLKPSTRLARERVSAKSQIVNRESQIDSDLDWIVMKCLEKDRNRRYETANGLAADIQAHLHNEPVVARPPSALYRIQKTIRRNKLAFTSAAIVSLALVAGIAVSSWQAARAERERARAERRLQASLEFIDRVFDSVSPDVNTLIGGAKANRELANGGLKLMEEFRKDTELSQDFRLTLAQLQTQLGFTQCWPVGNTTGDYEAGLKSATEAISLLQPAGTEPLGDERKSRLARAQMVAGYASLALLRNEEALTYFRQMQHWATLLAKSPDKRLAAEGRTFGQWSALCIGEVLVQLGPENVQRAIDEWFLPRLSELREAMSANSSTSFFVLVELRGVTDDLGVAYSKLDKPSEALPYFREANHLVSALAAQRPNNADIAHLLVEAGAKLGATLLTLQQPEEGVRLLDACLEQAESLVKRDMANVGFGQLRITVLRYCALGKASWSEDATSAPAERRQRLEKAQADLDRAVILLSGLPTESSKNWLRPDLEQTRTKVAAARAKLEGASRGQPKAEQGTAP